MGKKEKKNGRGGVRGLIRKIILGYSLSDIETDVEDLERAITHIEGLIEKAEERGFKKAIELRVACEMIQEDRISKQGREMLRKLAKEYEKELKKHYGTK